MELTPELKEAIIEWLKDSMEIEMRAITEYHTREIMEIKAKVYIDNQYICDASCSPEPEKYF